MVIFFSYLGWIFFVISFETAYLAENVNSALLISVGVSIRPCMHLACYHIEWLLLWQIQASNFILII